MENNLIKVKVYKNGYEIIGHSAPIICYQVSIWHWTGSNIILGNDKEAKEYTSSKDNKENPNEGYSWLVFNPNYVNLKWVFDDLIISLERWVKEFLNNEVVIEHIDNNLIK